MRKIDCGRDWKLFQLQDGSYKLQIATVVRYPKTMEEAYSILSDWGL